MIGRCAAGIVVGMLASWDAAPAQGGAWVVVPARPTVGDTVWLEREVAVPAGWQIRAGKLESSEAVEPLADPAVLRSPDGWVVRYAVVAWRPGIERLTLPAIWRLAPDGRADSTPGGVAGFAVASVIPDTVTAPGPQGPLAPLRVRHTSPVPPLAAAAITLALLGAGVALRRRPPRAPSPAPHLPVEREVPDARWLAAGEPKAVAARAAWRLRTALARAVPEAHPALAVGECLAAVARARPDAPLRELRDLLEQLDRVAFASAHEMDSAALAALARRLAQALAP